MQSPVRLQYFLLLATPFCGNSTLCRPPLYMLSVWVLGSHISGCKVLLCPASASLLGMQPCTIAEPAAAKVAWHSCLRFPCPDGEISHRCQASDELGREALQILLMCNLLHTCRPLVNRAARICHGAAQAGQVLAPLDVVQKLLQALTGLQGFEVRPHHCGRGPTLAVGTKAGGAQAWHEGLRACGTFFWDFYDL